MSKNKPHIGDAAVLIGCIIAVTVVIVSDLHQAGVLQRVFFDKPVSIARAP